MQFINALYKALYNNATIIQQLTNALYNMEKNMDYGSLFHTPAKTLPTLLKAIVFLWTLGNSMTLYLNLTGNTF